METKATEIKCEVNGMEDSKDMAVEKLMNEYNFLSDFLDGAFEDPDEKNEFFDAADAMMVAATRKPSNVFMIVCEVKDEDEAVYWNNSTGWGSRDTACLYDISEQETLSLPLEGKWESISGRVMVERIEEAYNSLWDIAEAYGDCETKELCDSLDALRDATFDAVNQACSYSIKMSNGVKHECLGGEVVDFAKNVALIKEVPFAGNSIKEALAFIVALDSRNSYHETESTNEDNTLFPQESTDDIDEPETKIKQ
jgi:hypothetical protein